MKTPLTHPEMLGGFETAPPRSVCKWAGFALGIWLLLTAGDWAARFGIFRWQDQWMPVRNPPALAAEPAATTSRRIVPAQTGAGLTQMLPVSQIAARYSEFHPEYMEYRDARGYYNAPLPEGHRYSIVMVGDSFMLNLGTQNVAQVLSDIGGIDVYNHAKPGSGPFLELSKFIISGHLDPPPQVVVWNLTARELGASLFLRQPVGAWFAGIDVWASYKKKMARSRIRWDLLVPAALSKEWPNTSMVAYTSRRLWAQVRLLGLRAWPRDVLGAEDPKFGPILFYRENLRMLPRLTPGENTPEIVQVASKIAAGFRRQGVSLVVLLVPEKEQIHARALSEADRQALAGGQALFADIEQGLQAAGTPVVNLMPVFQDATARGERLYWRDDTHWNDAGIRLAAEELWRVVEPLLEGDQESISNIQHPISNVQVSDN